jgi:hypothetical protein
MSKLPEPHAIDAYLNHYIEVTFVNKITSNDRRFKNWVLSWHQKVTKSGLTIFLVNGLADWRSKGGFTPALLDINKAKIVMAGSKVFIKKSDYSDQLQNHRANLSKRF